MQIKQIHPTRIEPSRPERGPLSINMKLQPQVASIETLETQRGAMFRHGVQIFDQAVSRVDDTLKWTEERNTLSITDNELQIETQGNSPFMSPIETRMVSVEETITEVKHPSIVPRKACVRSPTRP